jgi:hypothetical protein
MADDIRVTLACGCRVRLGGADGAPYCEQHDEHRVQSVSAPAPRITAVNCAASGPYVKESHG